MYPVTIVDNFFEEPDEIVKLSQQYEFKKTDGRWPGYRTELFPHINPDLNQYVTDKIIRLFYTGGVDFRLLGSFQKCPAMHEDQYHPKNRGWIHRDGPFQFGGIIYLGKNPEPDTGTSIYRIKNGYAPNDPSLNAVKHRHLMGEDVTDEEYLQAFNKWHDNFEESVKVENVYNRMLLFNNQTYHAIKTYGTMSAEEPRLTIAFFGAFQSWEFHPPLLR
jgi:hypothetical protein